MSVVRHRLFLRLTLLCVLSISANAQADSFDRCPSNMNRSSPVEGDVYLMSKNNRLTKIVDGSAPSTGQYIKERYLINKDTDINIYYFFKSQSYNLFSASRAMIYKTNGRSRRNNKIILTKSGINEDEYRDSKLSDITYDLDKYSDMHEDYKMGATYFKSKVINGYHLSWENSGNDSYNMYYYSSTPDSAMIDELNQHLVPSIPSDIKNYRALYKSRIIKIIGTPQGNCARFSFLSERNSLENLTHLIINLSRIKEPENDDRAIPIHIELVFRQ